MLKFMATPAFIILKHFKNKRRNQTLQEVPEQGPKIGEFNSDFSLHAGEWGQKGMTEL